MTTISATSDATRVGAPPTRQVYTVKEFCEAYAISRGTLFSLWREGRGPKFMKLGGGGFGGRTGGS
jgi:predicted DNA-binding transcriptional regulator AlpA